MPYPKMPDLDRLTGRIKLYAQLKAEYGAKGISSTLSDMEKALQSGLAQLKRLPIDRQLATREPSNLKQIRALRPPGPRRIRGNFEKQNCQDRLEGALLGRMAGCTLGAPVEFWSIAAMRALALENGDDYPPTDYWRYVPSPAEKRYEMSRRDSYTRGGLNGVPVDDDIAYTLLGLLIKVIR